MTDNRNIFADRWDELYNSLPSEKKNRIDKIEENGIDSYQLKVIKRKRIYPEIGDVCLFADRIAIFLRDSSK